MREGYANNVDLFLGPSDPSSWRFTPAGPQGNYQTAAVSGINFWVFHVSMNREAVLAASITMKTLFRIP